MQPVSARTRAAHSRQQQEMEQPERNINSGRDGETEAPTTPQQLLQTPMQQPDLSGVNRPLRPPTFMDRLGVRVTEGRERVMASIFEQANVQTRLHTQRLCCDRLTVCIPFFLVIGVLVFFAYDGFNHNDNAAGGSCVGAAGAAFAGMMAYMRHLNETNPAPTQVNADELLHGRREDGYGTMA